MRYLSVCSGIEAATVAWKPLGWEAVAFSEIERFPSSVLAHHYPQTTNRGDMNDFASWPDATVDVLVGGTPCQSFSVAGLRQGLADPRGNLALVYLAIAARYRPEWLVWENVPGVLSSDGGRAFGAIVGAMVKLGYRCAWRVLDAQYFGVPQRRRRVFVVGHFGDWRPAAAVLLEPSSLRRNSPPGREAGQAVTGTITGGASLSGMGPAGRGHEVENAMIPVAAPLSAGSNPNSNAAGRRREDDENIVVAFAQNQREEVRLMDKAGALAAEPGAKQQTYVFSDVAQPVRSNPHNNSDPGMEARMHIMHGMAVRRLTPLECERLQGFPDGYTDIPGASDSARYKALGNSMAVPVMRWIGERLLPHRRS